MKQRTFLVKNKHGVIVEARTCDYSFQIEEMLDAFEEGDTLSIMQPRKPKPAAEQNNLVDEAKDRNGEL